MGTSEQQPNMQQLGAVNVHTLLGGTDLENVLVLQSDEQHGCMLMRILHVLVAESVQQGEPALDDLPLGHVCSREGDLH